MGQSHRVADFARPLGRGAGGRGAGRSPGPGPGATRRRRRQAGRRRPRPRWDGRGRPGCSPRHAPPTAHTTPCRSAASRWPSSPSASPPPKAASRTSAPELGRALDAGLPPGTQRYGWPLLLSAAEAEADARGLPAAEEGRAEALERLIKAARSLTTGAPAWLAHEKWVRAELHRAEGRDTPALWTEAVTAFECLERPYELARGRHRLAAALLDTGGEDERARATELLLLAGTVARHLGARPLADAVDLLGRRARLTLGRAAGPERAPADPAEALGQQGT
ncbi:hypothetical protein GCM10010279_63080 [Streptomyces mutabilis]|nr:hypothetical protein GCM10010279_63080 [Streptomyces mutabilis]